MRIYLDTNVLAYLLYNIGELSDDVYMMLSDCSNTLWTSSVCVHELIHLIQIGKVQKVSNGKRKNIPPNSVVSSIAEAEIKVVPISLLHLETLASMPMYPEHRDPNDRIIIAQAITDRVHLVSSDHKFAQYENQGLKFIFNKR